MKYVIIEEYEGVASCVDDQDSIDEAKLAVERFCEGVKDTDYSDAKYSFIEVGKEINDAISFLANLYHIKNDEEDKVIDFIFSNIDRFYREDKFDVVDEILKKIYFGKYIKLSIMLSIVAITKRSKEKLHNREALLERIRKEILTNYSDRAEKLLKGVK